MQFSSSHQAGGFYKTISLVIIDKHFYLEYDLRQMGGGNKFELTGNVIANDKNYYILGIQKYNETKLDTYTSVLNVYIFEEKMLTDDSYGITDFIIASNTPSCNKHFDCVICLNHNVPFWYTMEDKILDDLKSLSGAQLLRFKDPKYIYKYMMKLEL